MAKLSEMLAQRHEKRASTPARTRTLRPRDPTHDDLRTRGNRTRPDRGRSTRRKQLDQRRKMVG